MIPALEKLLKDVSSSSAEAQAEAIFQLAMLLEKNTRPSDEAGFYESILPPGLLSLTLDTDKQREVLTRLRPSLQSAEASPSIIWALGKASPEAGTPFLLAFLGERSRSLSDEVAYQAVIVLENFLAVDAEGKLPPAIAREFREKNPASFLTEKSRSADTRLAEQARKVLQRINRKRALGD
jgi:hypothetical protein